MQEITREQVLSDRDNFDTLLKYMATNNKQQFNFNKAIEEATEFNDALVKMQTKHVSNPKKPTKDDILKEYADFQYRGYVALMSLFPELSTDEIDDRIDEHMFKKLGKLQDYLEEGKYNNGL